MAGATHRIDIGDDDLLEPWPTVFDLAHNTDVDAWVIVGGLMVQMHAYRAQIPAPRPTKDVDLVLNLTAASGSFMSIAAKLRTLGFDPLVPDGVNQPLYRFERGGEQVDVMVPDHLPSHLVTRFMRRPAFAVDAGAQALNRRDRFEVVAGEREISVFAPDVLGAMVAKGAATLVDQRNPDRHIRDGAMLLASVESVGDLGLHLISKNDRRRLRVLALELREPDSSGWGGLEGDFLERGQANLQRVVKAASITL